MSVSRPANKQTLCESHNPAVRLGGVFAHLRYTLTNATMLITSQLVCVKINIIMDDIPKYLIFDTCSLVENEGVLDFFSKINSQRAKTTVIVIPIQVMAELRSLQSRYHTTERATKILNGIDAMRQKSSAVVVPQRKHERDSAVESFARCPDAYILSCANYFHRKFDGVVLVTEDVFLTIKASAYDVKVLNFRAVTRLL